MNPNPVRVGLLYNPSLPDFLKDNPGCCDYIEIVPDMFWTDKGHGKKDRFEPIPSWVKIADWLAGDYPLVAHNVGFSLGTASHFDFEYLENLQKWHEKYKFKWHSDHASYVKLDDGENFDHSTVMAIPLPFDYEVIELMSKKIKLIKTAINVPFLVENNVYFTEASEQDMSEHQFLNRLAQEASCGLILDIHNIYANGRNHNFDCKTFISELDLDTVKEIHIAGGNEMGDVYADSHAGPCPDEVWDLLDFAIPRCQNLKGVTFEFHDSYFPLLKYEGILSELSKARNCWNKNLAN